MRRTALSLAVSCIILASCAQAAQPVPKTEDDKALYNLGVMLSRSIQSFNFTSQELELVKAGLATRQRDELTRTALSGWALGSEDFVGELQQGTTRRLLPGKAGRPFKKWPD